MVKKIMSALFILVSLSYPVHVLALTEIEENKLELKIERLESDGDDKKATEQKNNEELFDERTMTKLKDAKKKQVQEVAETKKSLFNQQAVFVAAHDASDIFQQEGNTHYLGETAKKVEKNGKKSAISVSSLLIGSSIIGVGTTGVYFYTKKR